MRTARPWSLGSALLLVIVAGCGSGGGTTVVGPASPPPVQDNFFVTWEIDSLAFGPITCATAGASTVDLDAVNADTGARFVFSFPCDAYQGQAKSLIARRHYAATQIAQVWNLEDGCGGGGA